MCFISIFDYLLYSVTSVQCKHHICIFYTNGSKIHCNKKKIISIIMEFVKLLHILFIIWTNKLSLSLLYLGNIMLLLIYMAKKSLSDQLHTMDNNKKYNFCLKWQWRETLRTVISRFNLRVMNKLKGPLSWFSTFVFRGSSHRRKSAVWHQFKNFIWFGYIARLSLCGWRGYFTRSSDFYLPSLRLGRGVSTLWV